MEAHTNWERNVLMEDFLVLILKEKLVQFIIVLITIRRCAVNGNGEQRNGR